MSGGDASGRITARFVARASDLGFTPPPIALRFRLLEGSRCWTLIAQAEATTTETRHDLVLSAWLCALNPRRLEFGARRVIRADFDFLPTGWLNFFRGTGADMVRLDPEGGATVTVTGTQQEVAALARALESATRPMQIHSWGPALVRPSFLTPGQEEALVTAVRSGYYKIPRPLNLNQLAGQLGVSPASLSERLRRAEQRVITRYVEGRGDTSWPEVDQDDFEPSLAPERIL